MYCKFWVEIIIVVQNTKVKLISVQGLSSWTSKTSTKHYFNQTSSRFFSPEDCQAKTCSPVTYPPIFANFLDINQWEISKTVSIHHFLETWAFQNKIGRQSFFNKMYLKAHVSTFLNFSCQTIFSLSKHNFFFYLSMRLLTMILTHLKIFLIWT